MNRNDENLNNLFKQFLVSIGIKDVRLLSKKQRSILCSYFTNEWYPEFLTRQKFYGEYAKNAIIDIFRRKLDDSVEVDKGVLDSVSPFIGTYLVSPYVNNSKMNVDGEIKVKNGNAILHLSNGVIDDATHSVIFTQNPYSSISQDKYLQLAAADKGVILGVFGSNCDVDRKRKSHMIEDALLKTSLPVQRVSAEHEGGYIDMVAINAPKKIYKVRTLTKTR